MRRGRKCRPRRAEEEAENEIKRIRMSRSKHLTVEKPRTSIDWCLPGGCVVGRVVLIMDVQQPAIASNCLPFETHQTL